MTTLKAFTGINNVLPTERLVPDPRSGVTPLAAVVNADIGRDGEIQRRKGYSLAVSGSHKNVWQAQGFILYTLSNGNLVARAPSGTETTIYLSLGNVSRVWYCNLPNGRTTFSNGLINGVTDGINLTGWGIPIPPTIGALAATAGDLAPGDYQYQLTYVRIADGQEGGTAFSNPIAVPGGGISLSGLPALVGHKINVYLSGQHGEGSYFAGSTVGTTFTYTGANDALVLPCRTSYMEKPPVGTISVFWRGRVLTAVGSLLTATRTNQYELYDQARDFKQFTSAITLIQPVDDGVYVGTTTELAFLSGTEFDKLSYRQVMDKGVVLGSGVGVRGEVLKYGDSVGSGTAMMCIAGGIIVAGFSSGAIIRMTEGRYKTTATEVAATIVETAGWPQYIAIPQ